MPSVSDLFTVVSGVVATGRDIKRKRSQEYSLPLLRPSHSFQKVVAGYVKPASIPQEKIFDAESLIVSTDGEGSHSYSYVVPYRFVPNSNVAVLIPKREMPVRTKLLYSLAITQSRWRFSYGRKPEGRRLGRLELPSVRQWVRKIALLDYQREFDRLMPLKKLNATISIRAFSQIAELFNVRYGNSYELSHLKRDPNGIAFVSRTSRNNGISARVARTADNPTPAGCLTVALGGSVLEAFLQNEPTYQAYHIAVLTPKVPMTTNEMLWYATAIRQHQFRFNYGRQANRQLPHLLIPECPKSFA